jgi:hypothetical protein
VVAAATMAAAVVVAMVAMADQWWQCQQQLWPLRRWIWWRRWPMGLYGLYIPHRLFETRMTV